MANRRYISSVPSSEFHGYIPAQTPTHIDKSPLSGIGMDLYEFPKINEGIKAPPIPDYAIAYAFQAPRTKAYYGIDNRKWHRIVNEKPGLLHLVDKDRSISWQWNIPQSEPAPRTISLFVDSDKVRSIAIENIDKDIGHIELISSPDVEDNLIKQLVMALKTEAAQSHSLDTLYAQTAAEFLCVHLLRHHFVCNHSINNFKSGLSRHQLSRIFDYIHSNLNKQLSLDRLAIIAGISTYHFIRQFKQTTGESPHRFVTKTRMQKARQLLGDTHISVMDIAHRVGYESQSHFSRNFKQHYRVSPTQYRRLL